MGIQRRSGNAKNIPLGGIAVGHQPAVENCRGADDVRDGRRDHAASTGLGGDDHHSGGCGASHQNFGKLAEAFAGTAARFCLVSFDSDWLYPTAESRHVVHALNVAGAPVSFVELSAPFGHDSFLLDVPALDRVVKGFLE